MVGADTLHRLRQVGPGGGVGDGVHGPFNASVQDSVQMWTWAFLHQDAVLLAGLASSGPQRCWPEAAGPCFGAADPGRAAATLIRRWARSRASKRRGWLRRP